MTFAKDVGIAFLVFALVGALHAAGVLGASAKYMVQYSSFFALIAYAIALTMRKGGKPRPLSVRMRSLGSAWVVLATGVALGAEGLALIAVFIAAVFIARQILPSPATEA